ncbi:CWF19-like protein 2 homolog [Drosophila innubila]|uniref:CWF19-like protein 2 homolog n=1 Tax=Drosophila innubila TaxID=198719 RepID=UPI00148E2310|nr:CWF19-like protein 2 homolog [Drosophila innubila]
MDERSGKMALQEEEDKSSKPSFSGKWQTSDKKEKKKSKKRQKSDGESDSRSDGRNSGSDGKKTKRVKKSNSNDNCQQQEGSADSVKAVVKAENDEKSALPEKEKKKSKKHGKENGAEHDKDENAEEQKKAKKQRKEKAAKFEGDNCDGNVAASVPVSVKAANAESVPVSGKAGNTEKASTQQDEIKRSTKSSADNEDAENETEEKYDEDAEYNEEYDEDAEDNDDWNEGEFTEVENVKKNTEETESEDEASDDEEFEDESTDNASENERREEHESSEIEDVDNDSDDNEIKNDNKNDSDSDDDLVSVAASEEAVNTGKSDDEKSENSLFNYWMGREKITNAKMKAKQRENSDDNAKEQAVKKRRNRRESSDEAEEEKKKRSKKSKKRRKERESNSSSDDDNWVELDSNTVNAKKQEAKQVKDKKKHAKKSKKQHRERERKAADDNSVQSVTVAVKAGNADKPVLKRDEWMSVSQSGMLKTYSKERKEPCKPNDKLQQIDAYEPSKSKYELNPYWKSNGTGLPDFQKPKADDEPGTSMRARSTMNSGIRNWQKPMTSSSNSNWNSYGDSKSNLNMNASCSKANTMTQKPMALNWGLSANSNSNSDSYFMAEANTMLKPRTFKRNLNYNSNSNSNLSMEEDKDESGTSSSGAEEKTERASSAEPEFVTDEQINKLAAKALKAELKGITAKFLRLTEELVYARKVRAYYQNKAKTANQAQSANQKEQQKEKISEKEMEKHVLLTRMDAAGNSRPLLQSRQIDNSSLYGGRKGEKKKKDKKMETHDGDGQRVRYFADDDRYNLKEMFEREKLPETAADLEAQYARIAAKHKNPNDDIDDIFTDEMRTNLSQANSEQREFHRAIRDHEKMAATLENCVRCYESIKFDKQLMVTLGEKIYLSLPWHVGLQQSHCILSTLEHVTSCTQLDEDAWEELNKFRTALTRMLGEDIIFYEIANNLHKRPHLSVHCIPIPWRHGEIAPFYFKKAIEESETTWSVNKQLIPLGNNNKSLRAAVPKGLPYIWVNFGMGQGFAHVIEDQDRFPPHFVQEIIGGMLRLQPNSWRKPRKEQNPLEKVKSFADKWKNFDCTK